MNCRPSILPIRCAAVALVAVAGATAASAQSTAPAVAGPDSVTIAAGAHYRAGGLKTLLLGGTYRRFWIAPIRVPVLQLQQFDGGLRPTKEGGGVQTKNLHLVGADGTEFVFRSVDKDNVDVPPRWRGSVVESAARFEVSNSDPAGALVAAPLLAAAGVLHVTPVLVVMPDDPALGKFRKTFAGRLGELEIFPTSPHDDTPGFASASKVIDTDDLLKLLDDDPDQRVDARAWLAARLVDMLLNDWDRNEKQWKWARFGQSGAAWEPIPRDRDKALISFSGLLPRIASWSTPYLLSFTGRYGSIQGLTYKSRELDRRFLSGLEKPVWDSVAQAVAARLTDGAIDSAVRAMPPAYQWAAPELTRKLRERRDSLPAQATRFYRYLADVVDIHATDRDDRATIVRLDNRHVEVRLQSGSSSAPYFDRRFDAGDTRQIRVYLHDGDDVATIRGDVPSSIPVRVIGGNGHNTLVDSSRVAGHAEPTRLRDNGTVHGIVYQDDTFPDRRPMVRRFGQLLQPGRDFGARTGPTMGLSINHDYGIMPRLGLAHYSYGFDQYPYASSLGLEARYSFKTSRYKVGMTLDHRYEGSDAHFVAAAGMSQLEVLNFYGYGNNTELTHDTAFYDVHQDQWILQPAVAVDLSSSTDITLGPSLRYAVTDTTSGHFIAATRPYGIGATGRFGEVGVQVGLHHDNRSPQRHAREGTVLDAVASYYPGVWDVRTSFAEVHGLAAYYFTIPVLSQPFMALRVGGKKVFGTFPLQDAAFIGGSTTIRTLDPERYAGDASLYATAELRIPVISFTFLVPLDVGLLGTIDYGRVYVKGSSPGGWHNAFGGGFWIGFHELTADIRVMKANDVGHASVIAVRVSRPLGVVP